MTSIDGNTLGIAVIGGTLFFLAYQAWTHNRRRSDTGHKFPPSPPINSILAGHILPKYRFLAYEPWIEQYGPIISLRNGLDRFVVIGRYQAAMEIMEKQGGATVDRPRSVAGGEILSRGYRILTQSAGERFRRMRRAIHTHLQPRAAQTYGTTQSLHARGTVLGLIESPEKYVEHAQTYAATVILKLAYGKSTPTDGSDPTVVEVRKSLMRFVMSLRPGAYLVDSLPWLKYLPWYGRELRQGFIEDNDLYHRQLDNVKAEMDNPNSGPSLAKFLLTRNADFGLDETEIAFLVGGLFSAGSETTALAICNTMVAAALHPDAQAMVHAELDAVIGNERLPTFDDEKWLPVLRAFIQEAMRWRPLAPLGLAHRATQDIYWGDYCIPAGTTVYGSHWAISRDPEVFPDPDKFDLKRWLTPSGDVREDIKAPYFGFGRRVCPGQHVATRSIYINTALTLWSFRLFVDKSKPLDDLAFLNGDVHGPPVSLHLEPRFPIKMLKAILTENDDA